MTEVVEIPMNEIWADDAFNSRGKIIPLDVVDLAKDIERIGLIQPVSVMECTPDEIKVNGGKKWKLLAGFRRRYAHIVLKRETLPAIIHTRLDDASAAIFNLSENLNRSDLTLLQEARAIKKLSMYALSEDQIGLGIGKSRGWVQIRLMLLRLPEEVQQQVEAGFINQTQIRELYTIFIKQGKQAVFDTVKGLKDQKLKGQKPEILRKPNEKCKKVRTRTEILVCLENLFDQTGSGLHTRALAWAGGEISDIEWWTSVKEWCQKNGKPFISPLDVVIAAKSTDVSAPM